MQSMTLLAAWQSWIPAAWVCVKAATVGMMTATLDLLGYLTEPGTCSGKTSAAADVPALQGGA